MTLPIEETVSKRINSLRFLLIVFVVIIHNGAISKGVNFADGTEVYQIPNVIQKVVEMVSCFTCVAVPLFFIISSYLLYIKENNFIKNIKKKCRTILLPYLLWNILTILFFYIAQSFSFTKRYFANIIIRNFTALDWIQAFVGKFTDGENAGLHTPFVYQFWFLRDLFILNLLFLIIKKLIDTFPAFTFAAFLMLWVSGINIYIVNTGALFFFSLGYYIVKYNINYKHLDNIKVYDLLCMYSLTIIIRLFFPEYVTIIGQINILVAMLFFIKASLYFVNNEKLYRYLDWLKGYAFFVYALHGVLEVVLVKLSVLIIPMKDAWLLVQYFGVTIVTILLLMIVGILLKKIMPKLYALLTGGRV
jgi:surface polysaccharide O-acyltransferase-like enzyme